MSNIAEPIVILIKSNACGHCKNISNIWDKISVAMKEVYPKLRIFVVTVDDNSGNFDRNKIPGGLEKYMKWFPMILLVPGNIWDNAIKEVGSRNPPTIKDGVQILNGKWDNNSLTFNVKYDIRNPAGFAEWVKDSLEIPEFKTVQNNSDYKSGSTIDTSTQHKSQSQSQSQSQSTYSSIVKPNNTQGSHLPSTPLAEQSFIMENVCSLRIIERRK